ncbi:MAG: hypothetical protein A3F18_00290 [Legionellales bacterium RIFCSPHIGHO2_12_FULL_37_14]|nr:MAG: hypothetical protein A3F18_00290 [Legionellales bacterium RIFCSPHIGHO2_12_FULL_37_14]
MSLSNLECSNNGCPKIKCYILLILSLVTFLILYSYVDKPVCEYFANLNLSFAEMWFEILGKGWLWMAIFFELAIIYWWKKDTTQKAKWMFGCGCWISLCYISCTILKMIFGRARPSLWLSHHIFGFYGFKFQMKYWSFPSGHTTTYVALALAISLFMPKYRFILVLLGIALATTRIIFVDHYCSDVFGTTILVLFLFTILKHQLEKRPRVREWFEIPILK